VASTTEPNAGAVTSEDPEVRRLAREVAELRAHVERLSADGLSRNGDPRDAAIRERPPSVKRRLGRRRPNRSGELSERSGLVSRRRLFGLLGGAAAVGTGLAVAGSALTADPADAADGSTMVVGANANSDPGAATTLTGATTGAGTIMFEADQGGSGTGSAAIFGSHTGTANSGVGVWGRSTATGTFATGVLGEANTSSGFGVEGFSNASGGVGLRGNSSQGAGLLLDDFGLTMPPTSRTWTTGSFVVSNGVLWFCSHGGTGAAAVFERMPPLIPLPAPHRVYDSRPGQPNNGGTTTQGPLTFTNPPPTAANIVINCAKDSTSGSTVVPSTATALLMNLTVIPVSGTGALVVYANGASQPSSSSINWFAGAVVLANGVTSACDTSQNVQVAIVASSGAVTNFALDVIGYYP
jgi:hypothetical protein